MIENKENININLYDNLKDKKEEEKEYYIKKIKEKDKEILKLKNELELLREISFKNGNMKNISMRPNSFREEDKKNSFEINKSATIEKLSRISNKSPNQNSFLKGNYTLSSSCYIPYFSPKGKNNFPYNNRNIDNTIKNKNSIDFDNFYHKCEVKDFLDIILEKTKKIFRRYEKLNK